MSDLPLDESQEINRLWAKVSAASSEPESFLSFEDRPASTTGGREAVWEAVSLLKRQHGQEARYWSEILAAKERALNAGKERQQRLQVEVEALRARLQLDDATKLQRTAEIEARMRAVYSSLEEERKRGEEEIRGLRALLEQARQRIAAENARAQQERGQWDRKEQQYLLDIAELQAMATRLQAEAGESSQKSLKLSESLKEAKNAVEKTLSELLKERQQREQVDREKSEALRKVDEVQKHLEGLSKLWEEERAQWRELWDRERSAWESQRSEFATWEDSLRKERESWLAQVQAKEQDQLKFTDAMTRTIRESTEATSKISALMRAAGEASRRRAKVPIWVWKCAAAAAAILAVAYPAWRYESRYHFKEVSAQVLPAGNPSALAYDGALLWTAQWDGTLEAYDPRNPQAPVREVKVNAAPPYHPVGLAFDGEYFWSADAAQARILRHRAARPEEVVETRPSPGPAPTALAYDGRSLWSYDAANKALYRHGLDEASYKAYSLDPDLVVTAMAWVGSELWVFDSKTRALLVYRFASDVFHYEARYPLGRTVVGLATAGLTDGRGKRRLWLLSPSARGEQLERFSF